MDQYHRLYPILIGSVFLKALLRGDGTHPRRSVASMKIRVPTLRLHFPNPPIRQVFNSPCSAFRIPHSELESVIQFPFGFSRPLSALINTGFPTRCTRPGNPSPTGDQPKTKTVETVGDYSLTPRRPAFLPECLKRSLAGLRFRPSLTSLMFSLSRPRAIL